MICCDGSLRFFSLTVLVDIVIATVVEYFSLRRGWKTVFLVIIRSEKRIVVVVVCDRKKRDQKLDLVSFFSKKEHSCLLLECQVKMMVMGRGESFFSLFPNCHMISPKKSRGKLFLDDDFY